MTCVNDFSVTSCSPPKFTLLPTQSRGSGLVGPLMSCPFSNTQTPQPFHLLTEGSPKKEPLVERTPYRDEEKHAY